ncbi:MAG TPA: VWA domain-containing protein [Pyrinomonadaceae bacterium]|nr:VWA domain-containing protein [Pyrinomonadaceae bacterium]
MLTKVLLKTFFSLSLVAVLCVCAVHAQSADSLVLNVTVANEKGGLSRGLNLENFSISVDKQPQKILSLSDNEAPASIGILIDDSGSQYVAPPDGASLRDQLKPALERFFKASNPANEYFVVTFNNKVRLTQDWTSDPQAVLATLDSLTFKKYTSVWDAMTLALDKVKTGRNSKHILLLIGDGDDNSSKRGFKTVRDKLKASDVVLYSVGVNLREYLPGSQNFWNPEEGINRLHELTTASGGRTFFTKNQSQTATLNEVFESIALELRSQYQLVIAPGHQDPKAKWRKVKIEAKQGAERLTARTRLWYYR